MNAYRKGLAKAQHPDFGSLSAGALEKLPANYYLMTLYGKAVGAAMERRYRYLSQTIDDVYPSKGMQIMPAKTIIYGVLLVILGVGGYVLTQGVSMTALIPAAFGIVQIALGLIARDDSRRKHAMHVAAALGLLGLLGSFKGLIKVTASLAAGTGLERPAAAYSQSIMALMSAVFVGLCINSFIQARRAQQA